MSLTIWIVFGIIGYLLAWINILNSVLFAPEEDRDTFTLKLWILIHAVVVIVGLVYMYRSIQI